jgi:hypothetical protein
LSSASSSFARFAEDVLFGGIRDLEVSQLGVEGQKALTEKIARKAENTNIFEIQKFILE